MILKAAPVSTRKRWPLIGSTPWTRTPGVMALSHPGVSSFPPMSRGATHFVGPSPMSPVEVAEARTQSSLLRVGQSTGTRARTKSCRPLATSGGRRPPAKLLPGELLLFRRLLLLDCSNLGWLLLRSVHMGYQIMGLWPVSGPLAASPPCQPGS